MIKFQNSDQSMSLNLKYRDYFIEFLACLIPGFVFLVIAFSLIGSTILLAFQYLPDFNLADFFHVTALGKGKEIFNYPFWLHISIFILSYMFGFFLYRQDPKKPDHVSYLKNRSTVKGYNEWVIKNNSGLAPSEVQFPYCNLSSYLSSRGFNQLEKYINWNCDDESGKPAKGQKNRSKAFINKLKMRIAFYYPNSLSSIIKNEAHIRFASSSWYAFEIITKLLYGAVALLIFYELIFLMEAKPHLLYSISVCTANLAIICIGIHFYFKKNGDHKVFDLDHKGDEYFIDRFAHKITSIYRKFDILPFFSSMLIAAGLYLLFFLTTQEKSSVAYLLIYDACFISVVSFFVFYAKQKIEVSFHYQRVREIVYVIELANLAKVLDDEDIRKLEENMEELQGTV